MLTKKNHFLIAIVIAIGLFFRVANLDRKIYSTDEVRTFLRASGYTAEEFIGENFDGRIIHAKKLQKYQTPNSEKNLNDALKAFTGNPEHPPLYYILARFWMQCFQTPLAARYLAVLISFFVFPCFYWLCLYLFESSLTSWIATALIAISPLHVFFAQEARQYSLLTVVTLLSSIALLGALKFQGLRNWLLYAVTLSLGFYSHLFFVLVVLGQAIYIATIENWRMSQKLIAYLISCWVGFLSFLPWVIITILNLNDLREKTQWASSFKTSFLNQLQIWIFNLSLAFIDLNHEFNPKNPILYLILSLVLYSIYFLCCRTSKQVWLFVLTLIGVTLFCQILPDLILGGRRSITPRYLIPSYLGIQLAVAYLLGTKISSSSISLWQKRFWQIVFLLLLSTGILSCSVNFYARGWWTKSLASNNLQVASIINQSTLPLVTSDTFYPYILSLSHRLDEKVQLQLFANSGAKPTENLVRFSDVFLYKPSPELKDRFEVKQNSKIEVLVSEPEKRRVWLYKLVKE